MATLASLQIVLGMDSRGLTTGISRAQGQVAKFGSGIQRSLGTVVPISAGLAGIAVAKFAADSVRAAIDYEKSFGKIAAISNASADDIERWKGQVTDLAGETAKAPAELAEALFFLSSAGIDAADVMTVLERSAKASAVGLGSTVDVAKITANALNAYASSGLTAAQVTDTLVAAVREGSAEPEEFAAALGRILPIASKAGVGFDEVTASLAALSNIGLDVNEGVTAMRGLMTALFAPTAKTQNALKDLGLTADEVRRSMSENGLIATLRMLEERAGGNIDMMSALVPNVRALTGVFGLTAQEAEKVDGIFRAVQNSTGALGKSWRRIVESDAFRLEKALNDIRVAGQKFATEVLPPLADALELVADNLDLVVAGFAAWIGLKGLSVLPDVLFGIALGLEQIGRAKGAALLTDMAIGLKAAGGAAVVTGAGVGYLVSQSRKAEDTLRRAVGDDEITTGIQSWARAINDGNATIEDAVAAFQRLEQAQARSPSSFAQVTMSASEMEVELRTLLDLVTTTPTELAAAAGEFAVTAERIEEIGDASETSRVRIERFAGMSKKALIEFVDDAGQSILESIGTLDSFERKWGLTAAGAIRAMEGMAAKAGEIAGAFKKLDKEAVPEEFKAFLIEQGPAAVVAFVNGTEQQKSRWIDAWGEYETATQRAVNNMEAITRAGGLAAGRAAGQGLIAGMGSFENAVAERAADLAQRAAAAMRGPRGLDEGSPSKVTREIGLNFSLGFAEGIRDGLSEVIAAVRGAVGEGLSKARLLQAKELEAMADDLADRLAQLKSRIESFASDIRSGFEDFDLIGGAMGLGEVLWQQQLDALQAQLEAAQEAAVPDQALIDSLNASIEALRDALIQPTAAEFAAFLEGELAKARDFARGLKALQAAGLDPQLLADLAARGPEALPFIQALLAGGPALIEQFNETQAAINAIAENATRRIVEGAFGGAVERLRERVSEAAAEVRALIRGLRAEAVEREVDDVVSALNRLERMLDRLTGGGNGDAANVGSPPAPPTLPRFTPPKPPPQLVINAGTFVHERQVGDYLAEKLLELEHAGGKHHR